jgi:hypothetical protein
MGKAAVNRRTPSRFAKFEDLTIPWTFHFGFRVEDSLRQQGMGL